MKKYTDIKIARYDLRKLTEMYQYCKGMQSELKRKLKYDSNGKIISLFDDRCQAFVYRLAMNEMQSRMKEIKKNIRRLDQESTMRDIERQIRESRERSTNLKQAEVYDKDGNKYYIKITMDKINKASKFINEKSRKSGK